MIRLIKYYKTRPRFNMYDEIYTDIEEFVARVRKILEIDGNIQLVLEPGDSTHYEFLLIHLGDSLAIANVVHGWSIFGSCNPMTITPGYIEDKVGMKINPFTLGVLCQLLHDIYEGSGTYYDWVKALPIQIVRPDDGERQD